jgi:hypothetical protein
LKRIDTVLIIFCCTFLGIFMFIKILTTITTSDFETIEFPLSRINDIAQDDSGKIYVGLADISRVQVYDHFGNFEYGWQISNKGDGGWHFKIDDDNVIHYLGSLIYKQFSKDGNLILTDHVSPNFQLTFNDLGTRRKQNNCENIEIFRNWISNFIVIDKETKNIIINSPWYFAPINFPIPIVFYGIFWMYYIFKRILFEKEKKNELLKRLKP